MKLKRNRKSFFIPIFSMSDIAFLLLIFIMLTALINYRIEVKIDYPEAETAHITNTDNDLEIWIDKDGFIYIDGIPSNHSELEYIVSTLYRTAPETRIHIIADRYTPYIKINSVLEILQILQYRVVSFVVRNV